MLHCSSTWRRYHSDLIAHPSGEYQNYQRIVFQVLDLKRLKICLATVTIQVKCKCWLPIHFSIAHPKVFFYVNHQDFFQDTEINSHLQWFVNISKGGAQVEKRVKSIFSENYRNLFSFYSLTCSQRWGLNEQGLCVTLQEMWSGCCTNTRAVRIPWEFNHFSKNNKCQIRSCCVVLIMSISIRTQECRFCHCFSFLKERFLYGAS